MCRCGGWAGGGKLGCCSLCGGCCGDHGCSSEENGDVAMRGYPGSYRWRDGRPARWQDGNGNEGGLVDYHSYE